jgi:AcrR family transcriptional regulator
MPPAANLKKPLRRQRAARPVREQILDAFSAKAKATGIRGVMMGELASELRVSASTLYKHFASKEALTLACVDRWADELGAAEVAQPRAGARSDGTRSDGTKLNGFVQFMHWVDAWADANATISPAFYRDLETDYPSAFRRYRAVVSERKERGAALLRPLLKPEFDERVALAVLNLILSTVLRPEFADGLRISRHEAIRSAVAIWAAGALNRGGKLRALRSGHRE